MGYYIRIFRPSLWNIDPSFSKEKMPADGITNDMKTGDSLLSIWKVDELKDEEIDLIAGALFSSFKKPDGFFILFIPGECLERHHFSIVFEKGKTFIEKANEKHFHITVPDFENVGFFAETICSVLNPEKNLVRQYTVPKCVEICNGFIRKNELDASKMSSDLKKLFVL